MGNSITVTKVWFLQLDPKLNKQEYSMALTLDTLAIWDLPQNSLLDVYLGVV